MITIIEVEKVTTDMEIEETTIMMTLHWLTPVNLRKGPPADNGGQYNNPPPGFF